VNTPVTPATIGSGEASPHEMLAPLLSHKLNELTRADVKKGTVGREFISVCCLRASKLTKLMISSYETHFHYCWR
jgi:hypothetical protein